MDAYLIQLYLYIQENLFKKYLGQKRVYFQEWSNLDNYFYQITGNCTIMQLKQNNYYKITTSSFTKITFLIKNQCFILMNFSNFCWFLPQFAASVLLRQILPPWICRLPQQAANVTCIFGMFFRCLIPLDTRYLHLWTLHFANPVLYSI